MPVSLNFTGPFTDCNVNFPALSNFKYLTPEKKDPFRGELPRLGPLWGVPTGGGGEEEKPRVYSRDVGDTGMIRLKGIKANSFIRFLWIMEKIRAFKVLLQPICALGDFYKGHFVV